MDTYALKERLKERIEYSRWMKAALALPIAIRRLFLAQSARRAIRRYERTVVGGRVVISPHNIEGRFRVSAISDTAKHVIKTGSYEPEMTKLLKRFKPISGHVINVGANVGFYPVFLARLFPDAQMVYAIEPNSEAYKDLEWNIAENGCQSRVKTIQICIGESTGEVEFAVVPGMPEYSSIERIVPMFADESKQQIAKVKILPLELAISDPDLHPELILVDTEGAELHVFRGAEGVLQRHMPVLIFECDDRLLGKFGHSTQMLEQYLNSIGYLVRNAFAPRHPLQHPFIGEAIAFRPDMQSWVHALG